MHLYALNRGVLMTPFHNMALMSPATTAADVDRHTEVFAEAVAELAAPGGVWTCVRNTPAGSSIALSSEQGQPREGLVKRLLRGRWLAVAAALAVVAVAAGCG